MSSIRWEPVPSRLFTSLFDTPTTAGAPARRFVPATDIVASDSHYILRTDLPGVAPEDVSVQLDGRTLTISGSRTTTRESDGRGYIRHERSSGAFRRSVRLPEGVDPTAVQASFDRGVLEVSVARPTAPAPTEIPVALSAAPSDAAPSGDAPAASFQDDAAPAAA